MKVPEDIKTMSNKEQGTRFNAEEEAKEWIKNTYPLMDTNNINDLDEIDIWDMIKFGKHIYKKYERNDT